MKVNETEMFTNCMCVVEMKAEVTARDNTVNGVSYHKYWGGWSILWKRECLICIYFEENAPKCVTISTWL